MRYALITGTESARIARYLPSNYSVIPALNSDWETMIGGEDVAGWTLDDYVLPRLASGLLFGQEVKGSDAIIVRLVSEHPDLLLDYPWMLDAVYGYPVS